MEEKNEKVMTPEEFADQMKKLAEKYGDDEELFHSIADDLMVGLLIQLGYEKGIEIFAHQPKWYS